MLARPWAAWEAWRGEGMGMGGRRRWRKEERGGRRREEVRRWRGMIFGVRSAIDGGIERGVLYGWIMTLLEWSESF